MCWAVTVHHQPLLPFRQRYKPKAGIREALAALPCEQRRAYDLARAQNPRVVEGECPWQVFLKVCHYNYWSAAERVCDYWQKRHDIYGKDRYHRPLVLTGEGALSPKVVQVIETGFLSI